MCVRWFVAINGLQMLDVQTRALFSNELVQFSLIGRRPIANHNCIVFV